MFELDNRSEWTAGLYPGWSRDGERQITVVCKIAYSYDEDGKLRPMPSPAIQETDRYHGEPGESSLAVACETVPFKDGGELLLSGTAYPPVSGASVMEISVGLRRADDRFWEKSLRLFGPRVWTKGLFGVNPSEPAPLEPLPLRYEYAYGGADKNHKDQRYAANPVGMGFSQKGWRVKGLALPQLEIGPKFISDPTQKVQPAGFGPIAPFWEPRLEASQQVDQAAVAWGGCPFGNKAPVGLYNFAPCDQRFDQPFTGEETIRLKGLDTGGAHPEGALLKVPVPRPELKLISGGRVATLQLVCDTFTVDTDTRTLCLVYRTGVSWDVREQHTDWLILSDLELEKEQLAGPGQENRS